MKRTRVIIMGAAGRDFHNFNTYFRDNEDYEVVAFTATQIPNIDDRTYPASLAGKLYPEGIPIFSEEDLASLIKRNKIDQVVFAYSDISHVNLMHKVELVIASGADFRFMGNPKIYLEASVPVITIGAVRTGAGKSPATRRVCSILRKKGLKVVAIRHPMPYGDLAKQRVQRYATYEDMDKQQCTIEEREEYEPLIDMGIVVYAGVDYQAILDQAQAEADIIVWDGGNNDLPFLKTNLHIVIADPHRPWHEILYHPGEANVRMADVIIINKIQTANRRDIMTVRDNCARLNPNAIIIEAASPIIVESCALIKGRRTLVVEDGPTVTHGEMNSGAGLIAAQDHCSGVIVDPRPYAVGSIRETYNINKHLGPVLPAMGYSPQQIKELEETINRADVDVVVAGTPVDLNRVIKVNKPIVRVRYELEEIGHPNLEEIIDDRVGPVIEMCISDTCKI